MNTVSIDYTNWRGERRERRILPLRLEFTSSVWYPLPQWFIVAKDLDLDEERSFSCMNIHRWIEDAAT